MNKKIIVWPLRCLIFAVMTFSLLGVSLKTRAENYAAPQPQRQETVIFVVSGQNGDAGQPREYSMDALAVIKGKSFASPIGESENAGKQFAAKYYQAGQQYHLLFGGGQVGTVAVKSWQEGCNAIHATVGVEGNNNIRGRIYGLATNSETLGKRANSRRALTADERAAVMTLVKSIYRQHKTSNALIERSMKVNNLTATDLDGDGKFEVIGDFGVSANPDSTEGMRRDLFLIATPTAAGFKAELAYYQSYKMDSGFGRGIGFADQLDMDGDGQAEVVTINEGFDGYNFSIYKKRNGRWVSVHSGGGDAC